MSNVKLVGVAQVESAIGEVDLNIDHHLRWIEKARAQDVEVLVFPEVSLTGHHGGITLLSSAMRRDDARLQRLADASGPMMTILGFIEEGPAAQFYNSCIAVRDGQIVHLHRKINIPNYGLLEEGKHYATGRFVETYQMDEDWRMGLLICADLWNPALANLAFLHGSTLLISPISSAREAVGAEFDNPTGWKIATQFYSMVYGAPTILANRCGVENDLTFWGGSRIVDPHGRELAVAGDGEELITAQLDYDAVRHARTLLPTVRDSNFALVQRETNRLGGVLGIPEDFLRD
ncbi:MAG: nitrilase-related carbon-nitrogen hydrolase [Pseudomonadota bacterium]